MGWDTRFVPPLDSCYGQFMSYGSGYSVTIGPRLTPMVKYLVAACVITFLLQHLADAMTEIFGLTPYLVLSQFHLWQLVTYIFLHGGFWHILWNMFALWMFGCELERYWGSKPFLKFFLITGVGAGILSLVVNPVSAIPTIGASGSIYGILMAYGMMFPERLVYLYFIFPVKVKYFVAILGVITFVSALSTSGTPVAHVAHLGGMLVAFLYLKGWMSLSAVRQSYYRLKLKRARKRFKVYDENRRKREDDFWIQ